MISIPGNTDRPHALKRFALFLIRLAWLGGLASCESSQSPEQLARETDPATLHAVMTEQISVQLAQLNHLLFDLHRTQTELDAERRRRREEITHTAALLQHSADSILALAPTLNLDDTQVPRFRALAQQLREDAGQLRQQAGSTDLQSLDTTLAGIKATCQSCHELYRAP